MNDCTDEELIQLAKSGDKDAYGELFLRYRDQALGYARRLSNDRHMAEDIVQEALIKAFLHLGKLSHSGFIPWLQTIVRHQALMKLRRGGPYAKERPFSGFTAAGEEQSQLDFSNIDNVLDYVSRRIGSQQSADQPQPQDIILRKEMWDTIRDLLKVLSKKERQIFEAHFFGQLAPDEIASLFNLSTANVYKIISRSRQKVSNEKLFFDLKDSLRHKVEKDGLRKRELAKPAIEGSSFPHPDLTFLNALYHNLPYSGMSIAKHELAGWTQYAFKISVWKHRIGPLSMHDWNTYKTNALLNLGFHCRTMDIYNYGLKTAPNKKATLSWQAIRMIRDSIDRGIPAFLHDALHPEFALVYGYDDEKQLLFASDTQGHGEMPYSLVGHRRSNCIYIVIIDGRFGISSEARLQRLIKLIVRHAKGEEPIFYSQVNGLAAYDAWVEAIRNNTADPLGHASNVRILADARESAARFLTELSRQWSESASEAENRSVREVFGEAAGCYREVFDVFHQLQERFPFPGDKDLVAHDKKFAVDMLLQAKHLEERGIAVLESLLASRSAFVGRSEIVPAIVQPSPFFLF
ncbi:RNA polymerase sigma factor [Paenibacillus alkalitolerans]|uniref:RNA polymerase sigma factor n=1 Tax=Paenibacillus alkalitolerans TaxID=2799335 RepID=UPI0018F696B3|nr:RNA polymerase sigma factor [Paenibacillus alkalitolerans]